MNLLRQYCVINNNDESSKSLPFNYFPLFFYPRYELILIISLAQPFALKYTMNDPINDVLELNPLLIPQISGSYSEEVWFKYNSTALQASLPATIYVFYQSSVSYLQFAILPENVTLFATNSNTGASSSITTRLAMPFLSVWCHAIIIYSTTLNQITAYFNNQVVGSISGVFVVNDIFLKNRGQEHTKSYIVPLHLIIGT